jgi:hypothetical protein
LAWADDSADPQQFSLAVPRRERPAQATQPATTTEFTLQAPAGPSEEPEPILEPPELRPLGFAGRSSPSPPSPLDADFLPISDRWRIGIPADYIQNVRGRMIDPYNQNVLKGDYPIWDQDKFLVVTLVSDTLVEFRRLPVPSGVSTADPNSVDFFGSGEQFFLNQNVVLSLSLFKGDAGYKPRDWEIRITPVFNFNYVDVEENAIVEPDVRQGTTRDDGWIGFQEAFLEYRLPYESPNFDFTSVRAGIQGFTSDFRGFLFADDEPGIRLFGTLDNNQYQWNVAWFHALEKDTNSGLNSYTFRDQDVLIANLFIQDSLRFFSPRTTSPNLFGYTTQFSLHANFDSSAEDVEYDDNGFIVRPAPVGTVQTGNDVRAYYLGWAGDGHIGRLNLSHQFYQVFGEESYNPIADQQVDINAQFFAIELSYDQDWLRYRASFAWSSGDSDARDGNANGFDTIFDNPNFAGGGFGYFTRQAIRLTGTGVNLVNRNSFTPDLRTSKEQGQANFVNPGLFLYNVGLDAEVTPKLKAILNVTYFQFDDSNSVEILLHDDKIGRDLGIDYSIGLQYRPFLNNNAIITFGAAVFQPLNGFEDMFEDQVEYSIFTSLTFTY